MQNFSADLLEFESLRELLGRYVHSTLGRRNWRGWSRTRIGQNWKPRWRTSPKRSPIWGRPAAASRSAEPAIRIRFDSIPDVLGDQPVLRIEGAMLEPKQILDLTRLLEQAGEIRAS